MPPPVQRRTSHDHGHYLAQRRPGRPGAPDRDAGRLPARRPGGPRLHIPGRPAGSPPREPPIWRNMLSTPLAVLARWVHDPRAEARRTGAVLDPSAAGVVHEAAGQRDTVTRAVARDKSVATSVVIPRQ